MFHKIFASICTAIGTVAAIVGVVGGFFMLAGTGIEMFNPSNWPGIVQGVVGVFSAVASFIMFFDTYDEMDEVAITVRYDSYWEEVLSDLLDQARLDNAKLREELSMCRYAKVPTYESFNRR